MTRMILKMDLLNESEFVECLRIRARFIRSPEGSQKGQDAFLMEKAAEVIERTFRVLERESSESKPGIELLRQIRREINAPTEILPPNDFKTPEIPEIRSRFWIDKRKAVVGNDKEGGKANTCAEAGEPVASHA